MRDERQLINTPSVEQLVSFVADIGTRVVQRIRRADALLNLWPHSDQYLTPLTLQVALFRWVIYELSRLSFPGHRTCFIE